MQKKFLVIGVLLVAVIALSGCIKIISYQKISPDGIADTRMELDLSKLKALAQNSTQPSGVNVTQPDFSKSCDNIKQNMDSQNAEILETSCEVQGDSIIVKTKHRFSAPVFEKTEGLLFNTYKYDPSKAENFFGTVAPGTGGSSSAGLPSQGGTPSGLPQNSLLSDQFAEQMQSLVAAAFEFDYTVEMPGNITKAEGAMIEGNKAKYDVASIISLSTQKKSIYIESQEINPLALILGIIGLLLAFAVLGIIVFVLVLNKKQSTVQPQEPVQKWAVSSSQTTPINSRADKIVAALAVEKDKYSAQEIMTVLKENGFSDIEIQQVLSKLGKK